MDPASASRWRRAALTAARCSDFVGDGLGAQLRRADSQGRGLLAWSDFRRVVERFALTEVLLERDVWFCCQGDHVDYVRFVERLGRAGRLPSAGRAEPDGRVETGLQAPRRREGKRDKPGKEVRHFAANEKLVEDWARHADAKDVARLEKVVRAVRFFSSY